MDMVLTVRRDRREERGAVIVLTAMMLVVLMIMAAFVIDLGNARQVRRQNQATSDASALAGAQELATPAQPLLVVATKVERYAAADMFRGTPPAAPAPTCAAITCTYTYADRSVLTVTTPYNGNVHFVFVRTCRPTQKFFAQFAGSSSPTVCRQSVARYFDGRLLGQVGIIALKQDAPCVDFDFRGSVASSLNTNGVVIANCATAPPNNFSGANAALNAPILFAVGSCPARSDCVGSNATTVITQLLGPVPDPLATLPDLTTGFAGVIQTSVAALNLLPCLDGIYYVTGFGNVSATPTCAGKTSMIYLLNGGMSDSLKGPVDMVPPTSGPYKGVSIFLARGNTSAVSLSGNSKGEVSMGTLYARNGRVDWGGNIDWTVNGQVVADSYSLKGGGGPKNSGFTAVVPTDVNPTFIDPDIGLEK